MDKKIVFPDWEKLVRDNKELYLDSIIDRYGEENREFLSKKYDEMKSCFFETPKRLMDYIDSQTKKELIVETMSFLKEIGIDTSSIFENEGRLFSNDPELDKKLLCLFGSSRRLSTRKLSFAITDFSRSSDRDASIQNLREKFLKKYNPKELNLFGHIPDKVLEKYRRMSGIAQAHLDKVTIKYFLLMEYIKDLEAEEKRSKTNREKMNTYILSNFFKNRYLLPEVTKNILSHIITSGTNLAVFDTISDLDVILLSPYYLKSKIFDLVFDHECTHDLEHSTYNLQNGFKVSKCGIMITTFDKSGFIIEEKYRNLNESITQFIAIDSTLKRYSNKQYIFSDPKEDINTIGVSSSKYDKNLGKARVLIEALPTDFIKRRIEPTIDYIYDYFDETTWDTIDYMISDEKYNLEEFTNFINEKRGVKL